MKANETKKQINVEYCSYKGLTHNQKNFLNSHNHVEYCSYKGLTLVRLVLVVELEFHPLNIVLIKD